MDHHEPQYQHTQRGPFCLLLYAVAIGMVTGAILLRDEPYAPIMLLIMGVLMGVVGAAFHHLTVIDAGDRLVVRFGPLPLFRTFIRYEDIVGVEVGRTLLIDGWGIHYSIRGGWVWNLWGRSCVVVRQHNRVTWIGTDDPEALAAFLTTTPLQTRHFERG